MEFLNSLRRIALFGGLSDEQYESLAMVVTTQQYRRGQQIFAEGDEGTGFFVVMEGLVKICKFSIDGKEQILHIFGPGEPFAEVAVFTGTSFPANAIALEPSRVLFIPRKAFVDLLGKNPSLAMNMLATLSLRLKKFARLIEDLSLKEVPSRLATHLLYLSSQQGESETVNLAIGKAQLASLLGTIPETLSRILNKLGKLGLIETDGARIRILDRQGLIDLATGEKI